MSNLINCPTLTFFTAASWFAVLITVVGFMIGLWNAEMPLCMKKAII